MSTRRWCTAVVLLATVLLLAASASCISPGVTPSASTPVPATLEKEKSETWHGPVGQVDHEEQGTSPINVGDRAWTRQSGRALAKWPDLWLRLYDETNVQLLECAGGVGECLGLAMGTALGSGVSAGSKHVRLVAGTTEIEIIGSTFMIYRQSGSDLVILRMFSGEAVVTSAAQGGVSATVRAGEWVLVEPGGKPPQVSGDLTQMRGLARDLGLWDTFHEVELDVANGFGPAPVPSQAVAIVFVEGVASTSPTEIPVPARPTRAPAPLKPPQAPAPLKPPQAPAPPKPTSAPMPTRPPGKAIVVLHNNTQTTIAHVYFGTAQWGGWSGEQLGEPVPPGGTYTWRLQPGAGIYDLRAEDGNHVTLDQKMSVSISGTYDWYISQMQGAAPAAPAQPTSAPAPRPTVFVGCSPQQTSLELGQCTTLRWDAYNVRAIYLDGEGVAEHDSRDVCPTKTSTYTLRVVTEDGDQSCQMSVEVTEPPDGLEPGFDRPAMDIRTFWLAEADPARCRRACLEDPQCQSFTYVRPGVQGEFAVCWIKNGVPDPIPDANCTSGVRGSAPVLTPTMDLESNTDRPGMDYDEFDVPKVENCRDACIEDVRCRAFTFREEHSEGDPDTPPMQYFSAHCWLKEGIPPRMEGAYLISGAK